MRDIKHLVIAVRVLLIYFLSASIYSSADNSLIISNASAKDNSSTILEDATSKLSAKTSSDLTNQEISTKLSVASEEINTDEVSQSINESIDSKLKKHEQGTKSVNVTEFKSTTDAPIDETRYEDPLEHYNRTVYDLNRTIDKYVLKPLSQLYVFITPLPVKHMVTNFFNNIYDINVFINDTLQSNISDAGSTLSRLALNSTFGIFGLIDVATDVGFPEHSNDYGVTFGRWGMTESSYFVIPLMGPSTIRDGAGRAVSFFTTPMFYMSEQYSYPLFGLNYVDNRANLLTAEKIMDTVADDEYVFVRNSYLDYRASLIRGEKLDEEDQANEEKLIDDILDAEAQPEQQSDKTLEGQNPVQEAISTTTTTTSSSLSVSKEKNNNN